MAISKVVSASITTDAVGPTQLNEASNYAFTGTVTGTPGITQADLWVTTSGISSDSTATVIASNLARASDAIFGYVGSGMSQSSGIFTFPQTGIYEVTFNASYYKDGDTRYITSRIEATANNSTYEELARVHNNINQSYSTTHGSVISHAYVDVTDTSNVKVRFLHQSEASATLNSQTDFNVTYMKFIRSGAT